MVVGECWINLYILLGLLTAKSRINWGSKSCFPMDIYFIRLLCFSKWKLRSEIRWWFIYILASQSVNFVKVMLNVWIERFRPRIPPRTNFGNILWDCCWDDVLKAGPSTFYVRDLVVIKIEIHFFPVRFGIIKKLLCGLRSWRCCSAKTVIMMTKWSDNRPVGSDGWIVISQTSWSLLVGIGSRILPALWVEEVTNWQVKITD